MSQVENEKDNRKSRGALWIVWLGGIGLTTAVIVLGTMLTEERGNIQLLENKLIDTTTVLIGQNDALNVRLRKAAFTYDSLMAGFNELTVSMEGQRARNRQLARENSGYKQREIEFRTKHEALISAYEQLQKENEAIVNELAIVRSEKDRLEALLMNRDSLNARLQGLLEAKVNEMKVDSAADMALLDSLKNEKVSGFMNNTELTGGYGLKDVSPSYDKYFYGLTTVNGYAINRHFLTGIGVGIYNYNGGLLAPVYLDVRYTMKKTGFSPYLYADGGLLLDFKNINVPFFFINPGIGLQKSVSDRLALNLGAGLFLQEYDHRASFVNVKLGFVFLKNGKKP